MVVPIESLKVLIRCDLEVCENPGKARQKKMTKKVNNFMHSLLKKQKLYAVFWYDRIIADFEALVK
jgi:hypothetical protein